MSPREVMDAAELMGRYLAMKEDLATAYALIHQQSIQIRQADERGDEAMRRAHQAEAALEALSK